MTSSPLLLKNYQKYNIIDGVLAGSLTSFIMDLQASELLPKLKAMYDTGCVDQMACGSFDKVEKGFTEKENVQHF